VVAGGDERHVEPVAGPDVNERQVARRHVSAGDVGDERDVNTSCPGGDQWCAATGAGVCAARSASASVAAAGSTPASVAAAGSAPASVASARSAAGAVAASGVAAGVCRCVGAAVCAGDGGGAELER